MTDIVQDVLTPDLALPPTKTQKGKKKKPLTEEASDEKKEEAAAQGMCCDGSGRTQDEHRHDAGHCCSDDLVQDTGTNDISQVPVHGVVSGGKTTKAKSTRDGDESDGADLDQRRLYQLFLGRFIDAALAMQEMDDAEFETLGADDLENLYLCSEYISTDERQKAAKSGSALSDGSFPIRNRRELKAAIRLVGRSKHSKATVRRHIIKRARALGLTSLLPDDWGVTQEAVPTTKLSATLTLEAVGKPVILESGSGNGNMRIRVPFYVGGSISKSPGFNKRIYFGEDVLPNLIQEGKRDIAEQRQPLTVYARHAHAVSANDLPIGKVVDLEQEGRVGYATIEVYPTVPHGQNAQILIQNQGLNAVSLRSGRFRFSDQRINGESMLKCEGLALDGVDFAPDDPAQDTYGIEVLQEEALIEPPVDTAPPKRSRKLPEQITLEDVPTDVREQIEGPLRKELDRVKAEHDALVQEMNLRERDAYIATIAAQHPDREKALTALQELANEKSVKTAAEMSQHVAPILLEALAHSQQTKVVDPKKPARDVLLEMFKPNGAGTTETKEVEQSYSQTLTQEDLSVRTAVGGLLIPED